MTTFWNRQRRFVPLFFIFFLVSTFSWGQNYCDPAVYPQNGSFTVPSRVCMGQPVSIDNVPTSLINISYTYQYDGKGLPSNGVRNTTNVYSVPGSYTILQSAAGGNATGTIACRVVEVLPSKPVAFSVTACSNRSVVLTYSLDIDTFRYNALLIDWGDGQSPQLLPITSTQGRFSYTYTTLGQVKTVRANGVYTNTCAGPATSVPVRLNDVVATNPTILSLTSDVDKATINFQGPDGYSLSLLRKNAAGTYVSTGLTGVGGGLFTVSASPAETNCFKIVASDACSSQPKESPEVCSLVLTGKAEDRRNELTWQPYAGRGGSFGSYRVYRNGGPPTFSSPNGDPSVTAFNDAVNIVCGRQYCYVLEAIINNPTTSPTTVRSLSTCVTGYDNGTVVSPTSAFVSVQPNGVSLQTTLPTLGLPSLYTLVVTRAEGAAGTYAPLTTTDMTSYIDNTAQTNSQSYCYQVAVRNNCGALSRPTSPACTILLTNTNGVLHWTSASPFSGGPPQSYQLIFVDPLTGLSDTRQLGPVTSYQPDPNSLVTDYQLAAFNPIGLASYSNPTQIELGMRVLLPNAFTPNSDGLNDSFMAKGQTSFWDTFSLTVFDRWGGVVFNSIDKTTAGWNGDINGTPGASGYYSYKIRVTDQAGKAFDRTGQVLLIR